MSFSVTTLASRIYLSESVSNIEQRFPENKQVLISSEFTQNIEHDKRSVKEVGKVEGVERVKSNLDNPNKATRVMANSSNAIDIFA